MKDTNIALFEIHHLPKEGEKQQIGVGGFELIPNIDFPNAEEVTQRITSHSFLSIFLKREVLRLRPPKSGLQEILQSLSEILGQPEESFNLELLHCAYPMGILAVNPLEYYKSLTVYDPFGTTRFSNTRFLNEGSPYPFLIKNAYPSEHLLTTIYNNFGVMGHFEESPSPKAFYAPTKITLEI